VAGHAVEEVRDGLWRRLEGLRLAAARPKIVRLEQAPEHARYVLDGHLSMAEGSLYGADVAVSAPARRTGRR
jgi:hypothetical protein